MGNHLLSPLFLILPPENGQSPSSHVKLAPRSFIFLRFFFKKIMWEKSCFYSISFTFGMSFRYAMHFGHLTSKGEGRRERSCRWAREQDWREKYRYSI